MDKIKKASVYDELLLKLIPNLYNYENKRGGEGEVYFIDDNFVVKEYTVISKEEIFEHLFDKYCKECQMFAEKGFNVPKIYSWIKIPDKDRINNNKNRYFILEERIKGKEIYVSTPLHYEKYCKDLCSYDEFVDAFYLKKNLVLLDEIMQRYFQYHLTINEGIESSSEEKLESFIMSVFKMYVEGVYSSPDIFIRNLLVDEEFNINIIDNKYNFSWDNLDSNKPVERLIIDVIKILSHNRYIEDYNYDKIRTKKVEKILEQNKKVSRALLNKIIKIINKNIDYFVVKNTSAYDEIISELKENYGSDKGIDETISLIQIK